MRWNICHLIVAMKICHLIVVMKIYWSCVANLSLNLSWWDSWIISHTIYHESFVKGLWWICDEELLKVCWNVCCDKAEMKAVKDVLKYVKEIYSLKFVISTNEWSILNRWMNYDEECCEISVTQFVVIKFVMHDVMNMWWRIVS